MIPRDSDHLAAPTRGSAHEVPAHIPLYRYAVSRTLREFAWVGVALVLHGSTVHAQSSSPASGGPVPVGADSDARSHFARGVTLFSERDFDGALAEFLASYEIGHRPSVLFNLAVTHRALHHYPAAARAMQQYITDGQLPPARRAEAEAALAELQQLIGHVVLEGLPVDARVRVDGDVVTPEAMSEPIAVSTGRHEIIVTAPGTEPVTEVVIVAGGQRRVVVIAARVAPPPLAPILVASSAPPARQELAMLTVRSRTARAAARVDAMSLPLDQPTPIAPGSHTLRVEAPGFVALERRIDSAAGAHVIASARLARSGSLSPGPFIVGVGATAACGIAAIVLGAVTYDTFTQFRTLHREDPQAVVLSNRGIAEETATNVLIGATLVAAAVTTYLLVRTRFDAAPAIDLAAVPDLAGGVRGSLRVRF